MARALANCAARAATAVSKAGGGVPRLLPLSAAAPFSAAAAALACPPVGPRVGPPAAAAASQWHRAAWLGLEFGGSCSSRGAGPMAASCRHYATVPRDSDSEGGNVVSEKVKVLATPATPLSSLVTTSAPPNRSPNYGGERRQQQQRGKISAQPPSFHRFVDNLTSVINDGEAKGDAAGTSRFLLGPRSLLAWMNGLRQLRSKWEAAAREKRALRARAAKLPVLSVRSTANNNFFVLTLPGGQTLLTETAGSVGFKGARKSTPVAAEAAGQAMAAKCVRLGYRAVRVQIAGLGFGKRSAVKGLRIGGLRLLSLEETTNVPFNGCRAPAKRRL